MVGKTSRRRFVQAAAALGATLAWARSTPGSWRTAWFERRDLFSEGVASGDPRPDSVLLWTRRAFADGRPVDYLTVELAEDEGFRRVVARARARVLAVSDYTCRVLVGGLRPAREYWYRFTDNEGSGSRIGRTLTAPADSNSRAVRFAFVSCQNVCEGAQNAYRRMIFEDERAAPEDRLGFVLHLGDFIYEVIDYPENRPEGRRYDRRLRDLIRFPTGEKVSGLHVPVTLEDYRTIYRAYLRDPDLQNARARWPFVPIWDNHEFSWMGWQGFQRFDGVDRPAQTRKLAANQAWFEYQPARIALAAGSSLDRFEAPTIRDAPIETFDDDGLGQEANNLAAISSLTAYRTQRYGRNVELIITDQHSYRSREPSGLRELRALSNPDFPELVPQEVLEILDAGRTYDGGHPPEHIGYGDVRVPNVRKDAAPQTILGAAQRSWFIRTLLGSKATWKIWGNSLGTLDWRADPQNLPVGLTKAWPGAGYAGFGSGDYSAAYFERAEIYDAIRTAGLTGFVTVTGDRHSFWAGYASKGLPPHSFEPVGVVFTTGSVSAPGLVEALEHVFPKDHPLRPLFLAQPPGQARPHPTVNLLLRHGVRACLEYQRAGDVERARALSNASLSPHLKFVDMGGHGYAVVRATSTAVDCEFVCIPRPIERSAAPDGGPLLYRVVHRAGLWPRGGVPHLEQRVLEGDPSLSL